MIRKLINWLRRFRKKKVVLKPDPDFIRHIEETAKEVERWPEWKKGWIGYSSPDWKSEKTKSE